MNKRIKKLWIKALRSGKFQQAQGSLRRKTRGSFTYCCLGVLERLRCDIQESRFPASKKILTKTCMEWAGLDDRNPDIPDGKHLSLAELNDDDKSFDFIADRIEKYL